MTDTPSPSSSPAFRDRLHARATLCGTVLACADPALAQLVGKPFDFAWIDLEHSPLTVREVLPLALALQASGCAALARLPKATSERLTAILDTGVDGIVVPHVESADTARALVSALRYPPEGGRGFAHRRASVYGLLPVPEHPPLCILQIESQAGLDAVEEIAAVPGVDALVVGTADLSLNLGIDGSLADPAMVAAVRRVQAAASASGIVSGIAAGGSPQAIAESMGEASTMIVYAADVRLYATAVADAASALGAALDGSRVVELRRG